MMAMQCVKVVSFSDPGAFFSSPRMESEKL